MRTTIRTAAALAVTALALAGCGTTATTTTAPPRPAVTVTATTAAPTAAEVADQLGATGIVPVTPPTLYAYDEANAVWDGRDVDIATFATEQLRDSWKTIAGQFGAILLTGPLYAVADNGPAS
jgi:ABC-type amino acid transport substrate-binding protein